MQYQEFKAQAQAFLDQLQLDLCQAQVVIPSHWDVDHLCYRVATLDRYQQLKQDIAQFATLLVESDVAGRSIATYRLQRPLGFFNWKIELLELPAPKQGKYTPEGFEHIEVVCDISLQELSKKFPHIKQDHKGLQKDFNQELEFELGERNVKFHHQALDSVIAIETHSGWNALIESGLLSEFRNYSPMVLMPDGELIILMQANNLQQLQHDLARRYRITQEHIQDQQLKIIVEYQNNSLIILAQHCHPIQQELARNFQMQYRKHKYHS